MPFTVPFTGTFTGTFTSTSPSFSMTLLSFSTTSLEELSKLNAYFIVTFIAEPLKLIFSHAIPIC